MPPKLLIASTMNRRPAAATTAPISAIGLTMPVVVSQCTAATWVTSGCAARCASTAAGSFGSVSGHSMTLDRDAEPLGDGHHSPAVRAVGEHEQFSLRRKQRAERGLDGKGAAALHGDRRVFRPRAGNRQQLAANLADDLDEFRIARTHVPLHGRPHGVARVERPGGEQSLAARVRHFRSARKCMNRSFTSCGLTVGRPSFSGEPGRIFRCSSEGPGTRSISARQASRSAARSALKTWR